MFRLLARRLSWLPFLVENWSALSPTGFFSSSCFFGEPYPLQLNFNECRQLVILDIPLLYRLWYVLSPWTCRISSLTPFSTCIYQWIESGDFACKISLVGVALLSQSQEVIFFGLGGDANSFQSRLFFITMTARNDIFVILCFFFRLWKIRRPVELTWMQWILCASVFLHQHLYIAHWSLLETFQSSFYFTWLICLVHTSLSLSLSSSCIPCLVLMLSFFFSRSQLLFYPLLEFHPAYPFHLSGRSFLKLFQDDKLARASITLTLQYFAG